MKHITRILRQLNRDPSKPLNILTFITHEPYECALAKTNHNFYGITGPGIRTWNGECRRCPPNYYLLQPLSDDGVPVPEHVEIDLILSHNKAAHLGLALQLKRTFDLPIVHMEHVLPHTSWSPQLIAQCKESKGDFNLFISDYNREKWGFGEDEAEVIYHGLDLEEYKPDNRPRQPYLLSCVNDWINRDAWCGYSLWKRVSNGLPTKVRGNTPGLSTGTKNLAELLDEFNTASIYLNTSIISPVPMAVLESMAMGCAVVTTATCCMPEIIQNGQNGFITNDETMLRFYCDKLLKDEPLARKLGAAARETIRVKFGLDRFLSQWQDVFERAVNHV